MQMVGKLVKALVLEYVGRMGVTHTGAVLCKLYGFILGQN
jgi:hypothetical protein